MTSEPPSAAASSVASVAALRDGEGRPTTAGGVSVDVTGFTPVTALGKQNWAQRLWSRNAATLLARNTAVSIFVFLLGLALLWVLVEWAGMAKLPAAAIGFICAHTLHYALGRSWIYRGTERKIVSGFAFFLFNGLVGLGITLMLFEAFLRFTSVHYLAARVLVSLVAGLAMFLLNAILNFKRL